MFLSAAPLKTGVIVIRKMKEVRTMRENSKEKWLFEHASVLNAIVSLAIPTVIGQIILVIYNMADTFFIGMTDSDVNLTAVTICMPAFMVLSAISNLFGVGGASVISRALGQKNTKRAAGASSFACWGCLSATLLYMLLVCLFSDPFVNLLGGRYFEVHGQSIKYLNMVVVLGGIGTSMNMLFAHMVRSEGHSLQASFGVALGGIANIVLDPLFMFAILPRGSEVIGAGLATALSNWLALLYFLIVLRRNRSHSALRFLPDSNSLDPAMIRDLLVTGLPACLMTLCENISYAVLDHLMALYGIAAQAGIGVAKKVNMLAHCIVRGMAQGVLPLIAYNYASGNHRRMRKTVLTSTTISILLAAACMTVSLLISRPLVSIFIDDAAPSLDYGEAFLRILCLGGPFSACAYAFISFFQAVGQGRKSLILALLRKGILDIPAMFLLGSLIPLYGIVWATPITDAVCFAVAVFTFASFIHSPLVKLHNPASCEKPQTA